MKSSYLQMFEGSGPQLFAVFFGTLNALSDGMQYGWSAPMGPKLLDKNSTITATEDQVIWLETIYMIGNVVGLPMTIYLLNTIGRKKSVLLAAVMSFVGWIFIGAANSLLLLQIGRFIAGVSADIAFNASPAYIAEIAHQNIRGFLTGMVYIQMLIGVVLIYAIGPFIPCWASSLVGALILVVQLIVFPFIPETPYFLFYNNQPEEAQKALKRFRANTDIEQELGEIRLAVERQKGESTKIMDILKVNSNRKAFGIMCFLNATQHMVGITVILMNLHLILIQADSLYISPETAAIMFAVFMLVAGTICDLVIDKYGRKLLLLISTLLTSLCLLSLTAYFFLQHLGTNLESVSWIPVISVMGYAVTFKLGLGIVPIVMTAELFAANVKNVGMAFSDSVYIIFSILSVYVYQGLRDYFGYYMPFAIFSLWCMLTTFYVIFCMPETKGRSLEEIQMILKGHKVTTNNDNSELSESKISI